MWARFNSLTDAFEIPRRIGVTVSGIVLFLIACRIDYDPSSGFTVEGHPFIFQMTQVTKNEALSLINSRHIKIYGVCGGQIVMRSEGGKWFALVCFGNDDVIRQVAQHARYVCYSDESL